MKKSLLIFLALAASCCGQGFGGGSNAGGGGGSTGPQTEIMDGDAHVSIVDGGIEMATADGEPIQATGGTLYNYEPFALGATVTPAVSGSSLISLTYDGVNLLVSKEGAAYVVVPTTTANISANGNSLVTAANYAAMKSLLTLNNVENTALSGWAGSTNVVTVGTIGTGTWNATAIANAKIATALSGKTYEGLTVTTTSGGVLTIANSKTLTVNDNVTFASDGTGTRSLNIGAGGTLGSNAFNSTAYLSGSLGAIANAALKTSGTGGATPQGSQVVIDAFTSSTQANVTVGPDDGSTTNIAYVISPKGSGAFIVGPKPDGTRVGGNARGTYAIDIQTSRTTAAQVASGTSSTCIGIANTAAGVQALALGHTAAATNSSYAIGYAVTASGVQSIALGAGSTASGTQAIAIGKTTTASATNSFATGEEANADSIGMWARATGGFSSVAGSAQLAGFIWSGKTTNNTATEIYANGAAGGTSRVVIPSGKVVAGNLIISGIKSDGSAVSVYQRYVVIKNVGGTTSTVAAISTVGVDTEDNVLTDCAVTADDTNDAIKITVTGITSETWRWTARFEGVEIAYGN